MTDEMDAQEKVKLKHHEVGSELLHRISSLPVSKLCHRTTNPTPFQPSQLGHDAAYCEFCGIPGIKHAFYGRDKRFCSIKCAKSTQASLDSGTCRQLLAHDDIVSVQQEMNRYIKSPSILRSMDDKVDGSFDWGSILDHHRNIQAASVSSFSHAPLSRCFNEIFPQVRLECPNTECQVPGAYWVADVLQIAGYRVKCRYEGFGQDNTRDFWINICSSDVHPVGWCASSGKPLVPPSCLHGHVISDWKAFLVARLTGAKSLPPDFQHVVSESVKAKLVPPLLVEAVDKDDLTVVRPARITDNVGGRLRLCYTTGPLAADGSRRELWCHETSDMIHPVGWAQHVGLTLDASSEYRARSKGKYPDDHKYRKNEVPPSHFKKSCEQPDEAHRNHFQPGHKLEMVDPYNMNTFCVATVAEVLEDGYLVVSLDRPSTVGHLGGHLGGHLAGTPPSPGVDHCVVHCSSHLIFPAGFSSLSEITITPPRGTGSSF